MLDSSVLVEDYFTSYSSSVNESLISTSKRSYLISLDNEFAWEGSLDKLKAFVHDKLCLQGTWTSPGGEAKLFSDPNYTLKWYGKTKRKLVIVRDDCDQNLRLSKVK